MAATNRKPRGQQDQEEQRRTQSTKHGQQREPRNAEQRMNQIERDAQDPDELHDRGKGGTDDADVDDDRVTQRMRHARSGGKAQPKN